MPENISDLETANRLATKAYHGSFAELGELYRFLTEKSISLDMLSLGDEHMRQSLRVNLDEELRERQRHTVDADPNWRRRNDLAPGIPVHRAIESALGEIRGLLQIYPIVSGNPRHPLGINLYQRGEEIPGRQIFCDTPELRHRVLAALVSDSQRVRS